MCKHTCIMYAGYVNFGKCIIFLNYRVFSPCTQNCQRELRHARVNNYYNDNNNNSSTGREG